MAVDNIITTLLPFNNTDTDADTELLWTRCMVPGAAQSLWMDARLSASCYLLDWLRVALTLESDAMGSSTRQLHG